MPSMADDITEARDLWFGNFFPDMRAWDKLAAHTMHGVGARVVYVQFPARIWQPLASRRGVCSNARITLGYR